MYYLKDFCCICFSNTKELQCMIDFDDDGITYNVKLTSTIPEMCFQNINDYRLLCKKCCKDIDFIYKFRKQCLRSNTTFASYIAQLDCDNHLKGYLTVRLTDLNNIKKENIEIRAESEISKNKTTHCSLQNVHNFKKAIDNFEVKKIDVLYNVKCEVSNYEQDNADSAVCDYIPEKEFTTKSLEPNNIADICYDIKPELNHINVKFADISQSIKSKSLNHKHDIRRNVTNSDNIKEEIGIRVFNSHINEANISSDIIPEAVYIKTEYDVEDDNKIKISSDVMENINTSLGSNIVTDNSMRQSETEISSENKFRNICNVCNTVFEYFYQLEEHKLTHEDSKPHQCNICKETLSTIDLTTHMRIHMSKEKKECHICKEKFAKLSKLTKHMLIHTGHKSNECSLCNNRYFCSSELNNHMLSHSGEKTYECSTNNIRFNQPSNLKINILSHTKEKPYECTICRKRFKFSSRLEKHMLYHTGEKPYVCSICSKRFSQVPNLTSHMRSHTGEKPYECSICNKKFSRSDSLKVHILSHKGDKLYECSVCNKKLSHSNSLKVHMLTHTGEKPYECNICTRKFTHSCNLKVHMLSHTDDKPYECSICNKRFRVTNQLKRHMRCHTGEKPYECNICNKKFSQSRTLKSHMVSHSE